MDNNVGCVTYLERMCCQFNYALSIGVLVWDFAFAPRTSSCMGNVKSALQSIRYILLVFPGGRVIGVFPEDLEVSLFPYYLGGQKFLNRVPFSSGSWGRRCRRNRSLFLVVRHCGAYWFIRYSVLNLCIRHHCLLRFSVSY